MKTLRMRKIRFKGYLTYQTALAVCCFLQGSLYMEALTLFSTLYYECKYVTFKTFNIFVFILEHRSILCSHTSDLLQKHDNVLLHHEFATSLPFIQCFFFEHGSPMSPILSGISCSQRKLPLVLIHTCKAFEDWVYKANEDLCYSPNHHNIQLHHHWHVDHTLVSIFLQI